LKVWRKGRPALELTAHRLTFRFTRSFILDRGAPRAAPKQACCTGFRSMIKKGRQKIASFLAKVFYNPAVASSCREFLRPIVAFQLQTLAFLPDHYCVREFIIHTCQQLKVNRELDSCIGGMLCARSLVSSFHFHLCRFILRRQSRWKAL